MSPKRPQAADPADRPRGEQPRASGGQPGGAPFATPSCGRPTRGPVVAILGAAGKSGTLSAAAARQAGASRVIGVVPGQAEASCAPRPGRRRPAGLADEVVIADATDPVGVSGAVRQAGGPADVTVVCVDVPGCEGGAILATAQGGTVIFFSMATSFTAAALGAEGVAADVTMLVGNGYTPGHAQLAIDLIRTEPGVRQIFDARTTGECDDIRTGQHAEAQDAPKLTIDPPVVREARRLASQAGQPIVDWRGRTRRSRSSGPCCASPGCPAPTPTACRWSTAWSTQSATAPAWSTAWRCPPGTR